MNKQIIDTLSQQLNLYRKDKSKKWKAIALQKAINSIKDLDFEIKSSADVKGVKGVGKGMLERIDEILGTGTLEDLATETINIDLLNKFKAVTGVGDVKAEQWIKAGFKSINDVLAAVGNGKLEVTHHIQVGLRYYKDFQERIPRSEIQRIEKIFSKILAGFNINLTYHICGSYRRGCTDSGDVDIIVTDPNATGDIHRNKYLTGIVEACKSVGFIVDDLTTLGEKKYMGVCRLPGSVRRKFPRTFWQNDKAFPATLPWQGLPQWPPGCCAPQPVFSPGPYYSFFRGYFLYSNTNILTQTAVILNQELYYNNRRLTLGRPVFHKSAPGTTRPFFANPGCTGNGR